MPRSGSGRGGPPSDSKRESSSSLARGVDGCFAAAASSRAFDNFFLVMTIALASRVLVMVRAGIARRRAPAQVGLYVDYRVTSTIASSFERPGGDAPDRG